MSYTHSLLRLWFLYFLQYRIAPMLHPHTPSTIRASSPTHQTLLSLTAHTICVFGFLPHHRLRRRVLYGQRSSRGQIKCRLQMDSSQSCLVLPHRSPPLTSTELSNAEWKSVVLRHQVGMGK